MMIVGLWSMPQYEEAFANGLRKNGSEVTAFSVKSFFTRRLGRLGRIQLMIPFPGVATIRLNRAIISQVKANKPEYVLFWRPTHIWPATLKEIENLGVCTISYNNDDPFGPIVHGNVPWHHHYLWYWYLKCLPLFDLNFFFREINCTEAMEYGAKHADILLPYFIPLQNRPVQLVEDERRRFETDVVFAGHYEADGRENKIQALVSAGLQVKLWGGSYWSPAVLKELYEKLSPIVPALGEDYVKALCGGKVCLCFLSKLNRDTYTTRCFEIPACGKVMLAERTDDLVRFFKEDEEACFFSSTEELVQKAQWLINNPEIRERIAQAGMRRVALDEHDVDSRAKHFIENVRSELARKK